MADSPQASKQDTVRMIYAYAENLLQQGHTKLEVEKALVEKGLKPDIAGGVVENLTKRRIAARQRRSSAPKLWRGLALFVVGLSLLVPASSSSDQYAALAGSIICIFGGGLSLFEWFKSNYRG